MEPYRALSYIGTNNLIPLASDFASSLIQLI